MRRKTRSAAPRQEYPGLSDKDKSEFAKRKFRLIEFQQLGHHPLFEAARLCWKGCVSGALAIFAITAPPQYLI
jgi:hypothetical protein